MFAAEVVETHLLALLIGNSAFAFGLMLAVFLVCLAAGAARSAEFAKRHGDRALARGLAVAGLSVAITLPLWDQLPRIFSFAGSHVSTWAGREACRALAALVILALPTYWMGTTFPLLLARVAARVDVARQVGRLTVANTLGKIVGSIVTGYAVLPALGSQGSLRAVAIAFGAAAMIALPRPRVDLPEGTYRLKRPSPPEIFPIGLGVALALFLPRWDLARLTNGANVYFGAGPPPDAIDFVREDVHGGVTTVARRGALHTMYTNGKFQGDDGPEMSAQRRFAHFPSLFVDRFDRALVIGLGTGTTVGTLAQYPWKRIDLAEISPSIVEASRLYFAKPSFFALDDPRVHLEYNDGRNHLLVATEPYDLVTIELTSIWFAGAASLYSREFYELVKARMAPDGVLQQWVQLHHVRRKELAVIVRTLRASFPHVALFLGGGQGILVASAKPLVASKARLEALEARPGLAGDPQRQTPRVTPRRNARLRGRPRPLRHRDRRRPDHLDRRQPLPRIRDPERQRLRLPNLPRSPPRRARGVSNARPRRAPPRPPPPPPGIVPPPPRHPPPPSPHLPPPPFRGLASMGFGNAAP